MWWPGRMIASDRSMRSSSTKLMSSPADYGSKDCQEHAMNVDQARPEQS
jgi:hypothetical protein